MEKLTKLLAAIQSSLTVAREEERESRSLFPNSFGHGFDIGYITALKEVIEMINEEKLKSQQSES